MAIAEISEFRGILNLLSQVAQVPDGAPSVVTQLDAAEAFTPAAKTRLIRIKAYGSGSIAITWANGQVETFDTTEFRGVRAGDFPITAAVVA